MIIKLSFFDKINDVVIVDALKHVFQRRQSKVLKLSVLQVRTLDNICFTKSRSLQDPQVGWSSPDINYE